MILFLIFTLFLIFYSYKDKEALRFVGLGYFLGVIIYLIKLFEVGFDRIPYFISDENGYYYQYGNPFLDSTKVDRIVWYAINYFERNFDLGGDIGIKLLNIPITILGIILLGRIFKNQIKYRNFILCVPYLLILMTMNLRDCLIITIASGFVYNLDGFKIKKIILQLIFLITIFYLRPVMAFIMILTTLFFFFFKKKRVKKNKQIGLGTIRSFAIISILLPVLYFTLQATISRKVVRYMYYVEQNFGNSKKYEERIAAKGVVSLATSDNIIVNVFYGSLRYVGAPIPTSLLSRILKGEGNYGQTDDITRMLNQIIYYYFLMYIFFNFRQIKLVVKKLTTPQVIILSFFFCHLLIYSFLAFGGTHQRTKIPFQLFIFIIYSLISYNKKNENYSIR